MNDQELKQFLAQEQARYDAQRDAEFREVSANCASREEFEQHVRLRLTACACMGCPKADWRECECVTETRRGCRCTCKVEPYASRRQQRQNEVQATIEKYWPAERTAGDA